MRFTNSFTLSYLRRSAVFVATVFTLCSTATTAIAQQSQKLNTLQFKTAADVMTYFHYTGHDQPIISGHRGGAAAGYPENCIATFENTLRASSAVFEIDPHLTKDSVMVLLHDATLERVTTGKGKLNRVTYGALHQVYLKDLDGKKTSYHLNTLKEAIAWCKGKTMLNLDVKDVPILMKARMVKAMDAFNYVMFTVHDAKEAQAFYNFDHRSFFSAWILDLAALTSYEKSGVPLDHILMAYVGPTLNEKNKALCEALHKRGVMVMIGAGPSSDKLPDPAARAAAYRQIIKDGADIIESDRPIEVAAAISALYPEHSAQKKFQKSIKEK